jgi:hypothetical protein
MIIVYNLIGAGIAAIALLLGYLIGNSIAYQFGIKTALPAHVASCLIAVGLDLAYRIKHSEGSWWALLHPRKGGHFCFVPIWVFGAMLSITVFVPLCGKVLAHGRNFAFVQPKNPTSALVSPTVQQPKVQEEATSAQVVQRPSGPPELRHIIWVPTKPSAQLDKDWAFEGDHVRGYQVTKISPDSVELLTPEGASLKLVLPARVAAK